MQILSRLGAKSRKWMECILEKLQYVVDSQKIDVIHKEQHAYRPGFSCNTAMASLISLFSSKSDRSLSDDQVLIFVDYRGAFDAVSWIPLVEKISAMNPMLANVIKAYLSNIEWKFVQNDGSFRSLKNKPRKGLPQGSILSPYLYNIFDSILLFEMDRRIQQTKLKSYMIGYADDHVFVCSDPRTAELTLKNFVRITRKFGMVLEASKTEFVSSHLDQEITTTHEDNDGRIVVIKSKQKVRWLGFNITLNNSKLKITLAPLKKLIIYLDELREQVTVYSLEMIYRIYIQSSLNFYRPVCDFLGQVDEFETLEAMLRTAAGTSVRRLPRTATITQKQTDMLRTKYKLEKHYYFR